MDEMNDSPVYYNNGFGSIFAYIILFVIIVWVFGGAFGGGFGGGFNRGGFANGLGTGLGLDALGMGGTSNFGFQNFRATCEAEKTEIKNTATTQYLIEQKASETQAVAMQQGRALQERMDYYALQDLRDKLNESQRENAELKSQMFTTSSLAPIVSQLNTIQNQMLIKPNITGVGVACPTTAILNGLGINSLNSCCSSNKCLNSTLV